MATTKKASAIAEKAAKTAAESGAKVTKQGTLPARDMKNPVQSEKAASDHMEAIIKPAASEKGKAAKKELNEGNIVKEKTAKKPTEKKESGKPVKLPKIIAEGKVPYEPDFTHSVLDAPKDAAPVTTPTQRYSDSDLAEFRELIMRKLETARKELAYLQGLITRKDDTGGDNEDGRYMTMEDGTLSMEREQLSQMASRQITFIDHLEKALIRIENKTYGICRETGKLIDKARLRAVPHATLSVEAKMKKGR